MRRSGGPGVCGGGGAVRGRERQRCMWMGSEAEPNSLQQYGHGCSRGRLMAVSSLTVVGFRGPAGYDVQEWYARTFLEKYDTSMLTA